jgi:hypothetical protein
VQELREVDADMISPDEAKQLLRRLKQRIL